MRLLQPRNTVRGSGERPARRRCTIQRAGAGLSPLFLGQMRRPPGIDIARSLPAIIGLMEAPAQRSGTDGDAVTSLQILPEQWHRPTRGLIAAAARVVRQGCRQAAWGEPRG